MTPDSFSDGGQFLTPASAIKQAEQMVSEGADIIDIGGESTRPGGAAVVSAEEELRRVIPVVEHLAAQLTIPISIDTTKSTVAAAALDAGAVIVNDISGLRFDPEIAGVVAKAKAGLVLMHSRGTPETLHSLPPVPDIMKEVVGSLRKSISIAEAAGVKRDAIVIDPGIGFGKSQEQNLELLASLDQLVEAFSDLPILMGTSRKSFIGRILDNAPPAERLYGTIATVTAGVLGGANILRVHDIEPAVQAARVAEAIRAAASPQQAV